MAECTHDFFFVCFAIRFIFFRHKFMSEVSRMHLAVMLDL